MALLKNITSGSINGIQITGSLDVSNGITGSLFGTSSWASNASTASYAVLATTASYFSGSITNAISASYALTASYALNAGAGGGGADITGSQYYIPVFSGSSSLVTSSIYQSGSFTAINHFTGPEDPANPEILYLSGEGVDTFNLLSAHSDKNGYVQINIQNYNNSTEASSDIVATADNGTESSNYIDMGINSSGFTNTGNVGGQNDAYVYSTGNDLYIGNASAGKEVIIFNGGLDAANEAKVWIHDQGTVGINTNTYNTVNPPSLQVNAPNGTTYNIAQFFGNTDNYSQVGITNANSGPTASSDLAIYNNLDYENQMAGYIDLGINSTNYVYNGSYPGSAGDAYLFTDSHHLVLGSISQSADARVTLFAGGISESENAKLILRGSNQHEMTGSLTATQGFTGSLQGTASYATSTLTASYVNPLRQDVQITGSLSITGSTGISGSTLVLQRDSAATSSLITALDDLGRLLFHIRGAHEITPNGNPTAASIYIGYNSGQYVTASSAVRNTALGGLALSSLTTGGRNVAVGQYALRSLLTGNFNTAIGERAAPAMTSGEDNTIIGNGAGGYRLSGSYNVMIGSNAMQYNAGSSNTAIGVKAGDLSSGDFNIFIGRNSGTQVVTGSYNIVIGSNNGATLNGLNNHILFADGQGNERFRITNTGEFLIGTTTTGSYKFQVNGTSNFRNDVTVTGSITATTGFTGSLFGTASWATNAITASYALAVSGSISNAISASYAETASFAPLYVLTNATSSMLAPYVLTSQTSSMSVLSASYAATASYANNFTVAGTLTAQTIVVQTITSSTDFVTGSTRFGTLSSNTHQFTGSVSISGSLNATASWATNALTASYVNPLVQNVLVTGSLFVSSSNATQFLVGTGSLFVSSSGQVGIGTTTPTSGFTLDNTGSFRNYGQAAFLMNTGDAGGGNGAVGLGILPASVSRISGERVLMIQSYYSTIRLSDNQNYNFEISLGTPRVPVIGTTNAQPFDFQISGSRIIRVQSTGNFTIGTTTDAGYKLDVNGTARITGNTLVSGSLSVAANGVTNLDVYGGSLGGASQAVRIYGTTPNSQGLLLSYETGTAISYIDGAFHATTSTNAFGDIVFRSKKNGVNSLVENLRIKGFDGKVGIGTSSPNAQLDISGSAIISGSLSISSSLYSSLGTTGSAATTTTLVSVSTGSYTAGFFDYTVSSGSNSRAGTVMSVWNGGSVQYTDNSTLDIGNTSDVTMSVALSSGNVLLRSTTTAYQWIIKTTYRLI